MSVIEDSRKVMQDFLAPELRGISARLDALEKRLDVLDKRLDGMDRKTDQRFDGVDKRFDEFERRADKRHEEVMGAIRQVIDWSSVQQRLARLESRQSAMQQ